MLEVAQMLNTWIYLLFTVASLLTVFIYYCPGFFRRFPFINDIVLFGKVTYAKHVGHNLLLVPKRYFCHFYVTGTIFTTSLLLRALFYDDTITPSVVVMSVLCLQTMKRLYENLFVQYFSSSTMSIFHYFVGHYFYLTMPISIIWSNNMAIERGLFTTVAYFALATLVVISQHIVMLQLANTRKNAPKDKRNGYLAPTGSMFTHVTCPHFTLEMLLYTITHVYLGLVWLPFTPALLFVLANQFCTGILNHAWYRANFPDFARTRRIFIPFIL